MTIIRYLWGTLLGVLGALSLLRALEQLVFGGGSGGSILVGAAMGLGLLMVAKKRLDKARAQGRPAPSAGNRDPSPS
ncbi:hypothetical protein [Myxococcus sp. Y35]|uniref:hypothetical protein n=1 Tax=Pseudomyxococcus flavus TaxID=3115648 RepID=UPI003CF08E63